MFTPPPNEGMVDARTGLGTLGPMSDKKPSGIVQVYPGNVRCLRCDKSFESPDKRHVRLCPKCRGRKR